MIKQGVRAFVLLIALYGATYTLSQPPPSNSFALLAQASVPGEVEKQCLPGYEYAIGLNEGLPFVVTVKTPPPSANPTTLPPGVVHWSDGRGGYVSLPCKEGKPVLAALPAGTVIAAGAISPYSQPLQISTGNGTFENPAAIPGLQNAPTVGPTTVVSESSSYANNPELTAPQKSVAEIDQQIQDQAQQNIQQDPAVKNNAFQYRLCQQSGACDVGTLESGNPLSQEQQLREEAQRAVRQDTFKAIGDVYGSNAVVATTPDYATSRVAEASGALRFYDNESSQAFLQQASGDSFPEIITGDGKAYPTSEPVSDWVGAMQSAIDSPQKFQTFESQFFDNGSTPVSYQLSEPVLTSAGETSQVTVDAKAPDGSVKLIPRDAYEAVRMQGDVESGALQAVKRIYETTGGKLAVDAPYLFPSETILPSQEVPISSLTPLSSVDRAVALDALSQELSKYPPKYWENSDAAFVYTFGQNPSAPPIGPNGATVHDFNYIWLKGTNAIQNPSEFSTAINHELAHFNEVQLFGSDAKWGEAIYGPQYGNAYLGQSGSEAIQAKMSSPERPEGFARDYGYFGGVKEDEAAVVEKMFENYPAVEDAAKTDPVLASKVTLAKQGFYNMSNGTMNDTYWTNLQPIDPLYKLPPPTPISTFLQHAFGF